MSFPPAVCIIGAQKAGTTTLAYLLDQHPSIVLSNPKEPHFYSSQWDRGVEWYRSCFATDSGVLIDASTSYTMARLSEKSGLADETVPQRIHKLSPESKFIYIMRDPVDRMFSAYWHTVRAGDEKRDLRDAVNHNSGYLSPSCYVAQIHAFLAYFDLSAFHFIDFRSLIHDPVEVASACLNFIGVEPIPIELQAERPKNQSFQYRGAGRALRTLMGGEKGMKTLSQAVKRLTPVFSHRLLEQMISKNIPKLTPDDREWLSQHLYGVNKDLKSLTGIEFPS